MLGIAPGPANGFTLDLLGCLERFGGLIDWAMLILNPLEPWPVGLTLPACAKHGVKVMTRVVDYGGVFHGDLGLPGHAFKPGDHRTFRPEGWVRARHGKSRADAAGGGEIRAHPVAVRVDLESEPPGGGSVVPTFIQEAGEGARPIEDKIREFAALPDVRLTPEEVEAVRHIGDNTGCMTLKGASKRHAHQRAPRRMADARGFAGTCR